MTYRELLKELAENASAIYTEYLHSKISIVEDSDDLLVDKNQSLKDTYSKKEEKLIALIAIVKNGNLIDAEVPEEALEEYR